MKIKNLSSPIIIIGMHRSGTSMLTRFIEDSGVFMGSKQSMGKNEEAFYFQKLNEWILFQKNATWDNTYNLDFSDDFINSNITRTIEKNLSSNSTRTFFGGKFNLVGRNLLKYQKPWGWKDPKNTLNLDIWSKIFPQAKVIHIYRNPIDVSKSLQDREFKFKENFKISKNIRKKEKNLLLRPAYYQSLRIQTLEEGFKLWNEYMIRASNASDKFTNVLNISYEMFLENPESILIQICNFIGIIPDKGKINEIVKKINVDRKFAFLKDRNLVDFYLDHKDNPILKKFNYDKII